MAKLKIKPLPPSKLGEITAQFNPNSYSITKSVSWGPPEPPPSSVGEKRPKAQRKLNAPTLSFGGGGSRQLTLELFYDVTEPVLGQRDVREETNKIVALTRIERGVDKPPVVPNFLGQCADRLRFSFHRRRQ